MLRSLSYMIIRVLRTRIDCIDFDHVPMATVRVCSQNPEHNSHKCHGPPITNVQMSDPSESMMPLSEGLVDRCKIKAFGVAFYLECSEVKYSTNLRHKRTC